MAPTPLIVAVGPGGLYTSPDGVAWSAQTTPWAGSMMQDVCYSPDLGVWIVCGGDGTTSSILRSTDGVTWGAYSTPADAIKTFAAAWSPTRREFMCITASDTPAVMTSPDGITWTTVASPFDGQGGVQQDIAWAGVIGAFVVVTDGWTDGGGAKHVLAYTADGGGTWTIPTTPLDNTSFPFLLGVDSSQTLIVAVGSYDDPALAHPANSILTSPDGNTWTAVDVGTLLGASANVYSGAFANGVYVNGTNAGNPGPLIIKSTDGASWSQAFPVGANAPDPIYDICWSSALSLFVAVGASWSAGPPQVMTSPDGSTWTVQPGAPTGNQFYAVDAGYANAAVAPSGNRYIHRCL